MDPQPHPYLLFLVRMKLTRRPRMSIIRSSKMLNSQRDDVEVFLSQISEVYPSPDWQYGDGGYHAKGRFRSTAFQGVLTLWPVAVPSATKNEPHLSAIFCFPPFPTLDEHILHYSHLQSNKQTTVWTRAFSLCMSPTLQMAVLIRNNSVASFCEEWVLWLVFCFDFTALYKCITCKIEIWGSSFQTTVFYILYPSYFSFHFTIILYDNSRVHQVYRILDLTSFAKRDNNYIIIEIVCRLLLIVLHSLT